jgi:hypothetical protein
VKTVMNVKSRVFLDELNCCQLLKEDSALHSQ